MDANESGLYQFSIICVRILFATSTALITLGNGPPNCVFTYVITEFCFNHLLYGSIGRSNQSLYRYLGLTIHKRHNFAFTI